MVSPQSASLVAVFAACAGLICLVRLYWLNLVSTYPAIVFFLLLQIATTICSLLTGPGTRQYALLYLGLIMLEWISYGFLMREIYSSIFSKFPGIAVLGRWSIYGAIAATLIICVLSMGAARHLFTNRHIVMDAVQFTSHSITFGFAALIVISLLAISRYPLGLHKNVFTNCIFFSIILLAEAAGLIVNQVTARQFTTPLNLAVSIVMAVCLTLWPILLSREGEMVVMKLNRHFSPLDEDRLLGQLNAVNSIMLRAARK